MPTYFYLCRKQSLLCITYSRDTHNFRIGRIHKSLIWDSVELCMYITVLAPMSVSSVDR